MRWWVAISLLAMPGAAQAAPVPPLRMPLASHFDLSSLAVRRHFDAISSDMHADARWMVAQLDPPPGPPQDPPKVRIRGKKVKMRLAF
jgi:hypothetical protein